MALIPQHFLLDPPDGGDVTVAEGVQRMAARIQQLEAALKSCIAMLEQLGYTPISRAARAALDNDASQRKAALDRLIEIDGEFL